MRLCMFHPNDNPLERGWVGRVEGDVVQHLAAQTLQSLFLGGGGARVHAEYQLAEVTLLVPVQHPPAVRVFSSQEAFAFANPAAVVGTEAVIAARAEPLRVIPRLAAVIGAEGGIGGFALFADWRADGLEQPKDRDFALGLGPVVATAEDVVVSAPIAVRLDGVEQPAPPPPAFDWDAAVAFAASGTVLRAGDVVAGPAGACIEATGSVLELEAPGIGTLVQRRP